MNLSILVRTLVYASLFIGSLLIFVPARLLSWSGIVHPAEPGIIQAVGLSVGTAGALIALWCILSFSLAGRGTPAPFDPPQRLVVRGPYRFMRNPMYIGAALALAGASLFYGSIFLLAYASIFLLVCHLFVIGYEEPTLRRTFGSDYETYCSKVNRWWPNIQASRGKNQ